MAIQHNITTPASEITTNPSQIEPARIALLKTPLSVSMDLFQVLDFCRRHIDELIDCHDHTGRMALYGRLYAGLEVLKVVLKAPLPAHLIERLTVDVKTDDDEYRCPLSTDSETLRAYCAALTMLLMQGDQSFDQEEHISGLLFELLDVLAEDLKAPRFVRVATGLAMIGGDANPEIH